MNAKNFVRAHISIRRCTFTCTLLYICLLIWTVAYGNVLRPGETDTEEVAADSLPDFARVRWEGGLQYGVPSVGQLILRLRSLNDIRGGLQS